MTEVTVTEEIELVISDARKMIDIADAVVRLKEHPDFKLVILDGYFREHAIRLVNLKSAPAMASPEKQLSVIKSIDGIGELLQYFNSVLISGDRALDAIENATAELNDIADEDQAGEG